MKKKKKMGGVCVCVCVVCGREGFRMFLESDGGVFINEVDRKNTRPPTTSVSCEVDRKNTRCPMIPVFLKTIVWRKNSVKKMVRGRGKMSRRPNYSCGLFRATRFSLFVSLSLSVCVCVSLHSREVGRDPSLKGSFLELRRAL